MIVFNRKKLFNLLIISVFLLMTVYSAFVYLKRNLPLLDFAGNRTICGYVLHGIYPYSIIGKPAMIESLGTVPAGFGNLPFGLLLGNMVYFGFFNYDMAITCFRIETFVLLVFTIFFGFQYFKKNYRSVSNELCVFFATFVIFSINLLGSLKIGNAGHIICMLILISIFTSDDNFLLSSICLSFAMIKPQIAVPFCITFLLYKKIKVVLIAAIIDVLASLICSFIVKTNVITMFQDFLINKVGGGGQHMGYLQFLQREITMQHYFQA